MNHSGHAKFATRGLTRTEERQSEARGEGSAFGCSCRLCSGDYELKVPCPVDGIALSQSQDTHLRVCQQMEKPNAF
jgi:hypothetical protein